MIDKPSTMAASGVVGLHRALLEAATHARDQSLEQARQVLAAIIDWGVTPPSGPWVEAAANRAAMSQPYLISNKARREQEPRLLKNCASLLPQNRGGVFSPNH